MSARVLNPAMMTEMSRSLGAGGGRAAPSRAALARVRRDLFGPVDHAAARALAERELRAQAILDAEKWGFDFHLEIPRPNSRYEWEVVTESDVVPEPYALRGMPYIRKHAPGTPRKSLGATSTVVAVVAVEAASPSPITAPISPSMATPSSSTSTFTTSVSSTSTTTTTTSVVGNVATTPLAARIVRDDGAKRVVVEARTEDVEKAERTPPQETRVPEIGETTPNEATFDLGSRKIYSEPTTPVLPVSARKQSSITDFMKSRKRARTANGAKAGMMIEPPEKIARNAGQIRS